MSRQTFFEMFGNYTTNEAINWRKFPHMRIDAPDGRKRESIADVTTLLPATPQLELIHKHLQIKQQYSVFSNPYDNGAMLNVIEFWTRPSKRRVYNSCMFWGGREEREKDRGGGLWRDGVLTDKWISTPTRR